MTDQTPGVEIRPAATVVVVRDSVDDGLQVLMLRRNDKVKFAGGAWVFPGGRVERDDQGDDGEEHGLRRAAVRECEEEAGLRLSAESLQRFSNWLTPANMHKRFDTAFFIAVVEGDPAIAVDGSEIHESRWMRPEEAASCHRQGEMKLMPPTYITLLELSRHDCVADACAAYGQRGVRRYVPRVTYLEDKVCFLYAGDAGYESSDPVCEGSRHRTILDSGGCEYEASFDFFDPLEGSS